jgi:hypothetical protein
MLVLNRSPKAIYACGEWDNASVIGDRLNMLTTLTPLAKGRPINYYHILKNLFV